MSSGYVDDMAIVPATAPASSRSSGVSSPLPVDARRWSEISLQRRGCRKGKASAEDSSDGSVGEKEGPPVPGAENIQGEAGA